MARFGTRVTPDGTVVVEADSTELAIGPVTTVLDVVGGPAWTISYSSWEKARYPERDTSDEGLIVDVVDVIHAMTFDERAVEALAALPGVPSTDETVSPRLGLFIGTLLTNLEHGLR